MRNAGTMVSFHRPDGQPVEGYLVKPAKLEGAPAIVVIQEWWGLNAQIRGVADRLSHAGYIALVPDLYRGKSTVEEEEAHHYMDSLDFADAISQDVRGAVQYLSTYTRNIGVTGFCMGGALTLLALSAVPEFAAGVIWYGFPPLDRLDASGIKAPIQAHCATQDAFFHRYLAHHAFANETAVGDGRIPGTQYDPVWAQLAWDRTLTFFGRTLWKEPVVVRRTS